jgi:hypothetical protein
MENNESATRKNGFFSVLYRTRVKVTRGDVVIVNLSALFSIISLLCAPWLVIVGAIVALALGYRFSIDRQGVGFAQSFDDVVKGAARNVRQAVDSVTDSAKPEEAPESGDRPAE